MASRLGFPLFAEEAFRSESPSVKKKEDQEKTSIAKKVDQAAQKVLSDKNQIDRWLLSSAEGKSGKELEIVLAEAKAKYAAIQISYPVAGMVAFINAGKKNPLKLPLSPNLQECPKRKKRKYIKKEPALKKNHKKREPLSEKKSDDRRQITEGLVAAAEGKSGRALEIELRTAKDKFEKAGFSFSLPEIYLSLCGMKGWTPDRFFARSSSDALWNQQKEPDFIPDSGKGKISKPLLNCRSDGLQKINEWLFEESEGKSEEELVPLIREAQRKFADIGSFFTLQEIYSTLATVKKLKPWESFSRWVHASHSDSSDSQKVLQKKSDFMPKSSEPCSTVSSSSSECGSQEEILDQQKINCWLLSNAEGKAGEELDEVFETVQCMYSAIAVEIPLKGVVALLGTLRGQQI